MRLPAFAVKLSLFPVLCLFLVVAGTYLVNSVIIDCFIKNQV